MRVGPRRALVLTRLPLLMLGLLLLGGVSCESIRVVDEGNGRTGMVNPAPSVLALANELHDVAVTAIDFDPPLTGNKAVTTDRISLLAVVENKGNQPENRLMVEAKLYGATGDRPLIESQSVMDRLVPGESKVVKFHGLPSLPVRTAYRLDVTVNPVAGESVLANNQRTYRVEVSLAPH